MRKTLKLQPIGAVRRGEDGTCVLEIKERLRDGLDGLEAGDSVQVLYWMHRLSAEDRETLKVHPRGDESRALRGVFALRSPMRPNPIGVSVARVEEVDGRAVAVSGLDALDGSPIVDLKGVAGGTDRGDQNT